MDERVVKKIKNIKAIVFDIDGTLTDGRLIYDKDGNELKSFFARDGSRITLALKSGLKVFFVSNRLSPAVLKRAENRKVTGVLCKEDYIDNQISFFTKIGYAPEEVLYMGDDLNDLIFMRAAGLKVAVSDATREVKNIADVVTENKGGDGAAAEIVELVMRIQETWEKFLP